MPKRPIPSLNPVENDEKKPRIDDGKDAEMSSSPKASHATSPHDDTPNVTAPSPAASVATLANAVAKSSKALAQSVNSDAANSKLAAAEVAPVVNGSGGSGNAFLRAQREAKAKKSIKPESEVKSMANEEDNTAKRTEKSTTNAVKIEDNNAPLQKSNATTKHEPKHNYFWVSILILLMLAINAASAVYILSQESRHNASQMRCSLEVESLKEELAKSRDMVSVLKSGMDATQRRIEFMEQAGGARKRAMEERGNGVEGEDIMSDQEKNELLAKIQKMQEEEKGLMRGLQSAIGKFE